MHISELMCCVYEGSPDPEVTYSLFPRKPRGPKNDKSLKYKVKARNRAAQMPDEFQSDSPLVSVVIPTRNSIRLIANVLNSIHQQTYKNVEVIVADNYSSDRTPVIAQLLGATVCIGGPKPPHNNYFTAPWMRQLGFSRVNGEYVYFVDSDMALTKELIAECVDICLKGATAVIVPEVSVGTGFWAQCKIAERSAYPGNRVIEAPRFIRVRALRAIGGWPWKAGGMDDWFVHIALKRLGHKIEYSRRFVFHDEGKLTLRRLFQKKFNIGKSTNLWAYFGEAGVGRNTFSQMTPFRYWGILPRMIERNSRVKEVLGSMMMKSIEAMGFYLGSLFHKNSSFQDSVLPV